jgi:hypothetical protein
MKIKMDPKHPMLIALGEISGEDYVLETLKKTKSRLVLLYNMIFFVFDELVISLLIND